MRKKLALLVFALAAVTATLAISPASALTCPKNSHPIDCGTYILCCPNFAFCVCGG